MKLFEVKKAGQRGDAAVAQFYNDYWPREVPLIGKTLEHLLDIVPGGRYKLALDAGCGSGACSIALAQLADRVVGADLSLSSLLTARGLSLKNGPAGVAFINSSIEMLPFPAALFDLILSWGACHHAENPFRAMDELARALKPGGILIVALYRKTPLTPLHEAIREFCLAWPKAANKIIIPGLTAAARILSYILRRRPIRDDCRSLSAKIEDWYLVPRKYFFRPDEVREHFEAMGLEFKMIVPNSARFKSTSNFIAVVKKKPRGAT